MKIRDLLRERLRRQLRTLLEETPAPPAEAARPFLALEGRAGSPIYIRPEEISTVFMVMEATPDDHVVRVELTSGKYFNLSTRSGVDLLMWMEARAVPPRASIISYGVLKAQ